MVRVSIAGAVLFALLPAARADSSRIPLSVPNPADFLKEFSASADQAGGAGRIPFDAKQHTIGFRVPVPEFSIDSQSGGGLPGTKLAVELTVRCEIVVTYDVSAIRVRRGALRLPPAKVVAAWSDPPGERGKFKYDGQFLRSDWLPWDKSTLERLKYRLLDEALTTARERYLRDHHAKYHDEYEGALDQAYEKSQKSRQEK